MAEITANNSSSRGRASIWVWTGLAVISLVVLIFAAYYYYSGYRSYKTEAPATAVTPANDSVSSIEKDLNSVDTGGSDSDLNNINNELK